MGRFGGVLPVDDLVLSPAHRGKGIPAGGMVRHQGIEKMSLAATYWGLSSNGTGMYAKGVDRYLPEMRLRRIQE